MTADRIKTSVELPARLHDRMARLRDATRLAYPEILERGLAPLERELAAAMARDDPGCAHAESYPDGHCRRCYSGPAPHVPAAQARLEQDEAFRDAIRAMGPEPSIARLRRELRIGPDRAARLLADVRAGDSPPPVHPVTFRAG